MNALRVDIDRGPGLQSQYDIIGSPTLIFFGADGREHPELRPAGVVKPGEVLTALEKLAPAKAELDRMSAISRFLTSNESSKVYG